MRSPAGEREAFGISPACYRYVGRRNAENEKSAHWLLRLTDNHGTWASGYAACTRTMEALAGIISTRTGSIANCS